MAETEINVQLDTVNKKQARFVAENKRGIEHPANGGYRTARTELIPEVVVYLDREIWMAKGSPSYLVVRLAEK